MAGFERHKWNFDAMLSKAMETLSVKDFRYATALADAFLNQENVASLDKLARWRKLRPLDPDQVSPDGTITDD